MGRVFASETGVLMQSQAEYNHALISVSSDAQRGSGTAKQLRASGSRISKIEESTQKMADTYGKLLQKIVDQKSLADPKTGTPYTPDSVVMETISNSFGGIVTALGGEKETNQKLMNEAQQHVVSCATTKQSAYDLADVGVTALQGKAQTAREAHDGCRDVEASLESTMNTECGTFDGLVADCTQFKSYQYFTDENSGLKGVETAASKCNDATIAHNSQSNTCDGKQDAFESAFCKYALKLESTCDNYKTCHDNAIDDWGSVNVSVHELEKSQKLVLKMVRKVQCYIKALTEATAEKMPTQADIDHCSKLGSAQGDPIDLTELDIVYPTPPSFQACDKSSIQHMPDGSGRFKNLEYDGGNFTGRTKEVIAACEA